VSNKNVSPRGKEGEGVHKENELGAGGKASGTVGGCRRGQGKMVYSCLCSNGAVKLGGLCIPKRHRLSKRED